MRDRRGRAYTPAVGPRLRPLLWIILLGFAFLGANGVYLSSVTSLTWWRGTTQQTPFYMLMIALHLVLGFFLIVPFLVFGFIHLATSWKRPNRTAVRFGLALLGVAIVILISGSGPGAARRLRGPRPENPRRRLLAARAHPARRRRTLCQAPPGRPANQVGVGQAPERRRRRVRHRDGAAPLPGSALLRRQGPSRRQAVLLSLRSHHRQRQVHPGAHVDDGRLLHEVPSRRLPGLVSLGPSIQLVQQPGLSSQRPRDTSCFPGGRRLDPGRPLVCRLPRSGAVLLGRIR